MKKINKGYGALIVLLALFFASAVYAHPLHWPRGVPAGAVIVAGEVVEKPFVWPETGVQVLKIKNSADCSFVGMYSDTVYKVNKGDYVVVYGIIGGPDVQIYNLVKITRSIELGEKNLTANKEFGEFHLSFGQCGNKVPSVPVK
ncbi:MAG: hypothetical protein Q7S12_00235 [bacterium]|nr:hypothetical protein [bacterium]